MKRLGAEQRRSEVVAAETCAQTIWGQKLVDPLVEAGTIRATRVVTTDKHLSHGLMHHYYADISHSGMHRDASRLPYSPLLSAFVHACI
jgi:hypothetical protein